MTFDKLIDLITHHNHPDYYILEAARIVIIDECHALISDTFIRDILSVIVWMSMSMYGTDKLFIGLTATPDILRASEEWHGFPIKQVLDDHSRCTRRIVCGLLDES